MRFLTKQIYYSMPFYGYFFGLNESYEDFVKDLTEAYSVSGQYQGSETIEATYLENIRNYFNSNVVFYGKLKEIIFDQKGDVKPFERNIFYQIKDLQKEYLIIERQSYENHGKNTNKLLENHDLPKEIKELVRKGKHDICISQIEFTNSLLKMVFDFEDILMSCTFRVIGNMDVSELLGYCGYQVVYEELFKNVDGSYEYNLLIRKFATKVVDDIIREIDIRFNAVEICEYTQQ